MEIRQVDPRTLREDPDNTRRTPSTPQEDATMAASIREIGLLELPTVKMVEGGLQIVYGHRRVRGSIAADLETISVLVRTEDDGKDGMRSFAENVVRAPLSRVDQWRATEKLIRAGWTEEGVATALALPVRTIKASRLLANVHPAMLDQIAQGDQPSDAVIKTIALAPSSEQAQVWKRYKPKKGARADWNSIARALEKRRMPVTVARFDEELARTYRIQWVDDLFGPADQDNRYTTEVEAFFAAQQEWLNANLPKGGVIVPVSPYGQPELPKGAQRLYSKPGKGDQTGWYVDPRSGEVDSVAFRVPEPKAKGKGQKAAANAPKPRPPLTQRGTAMLGDLRTDALHEAVRNVPAEAETLLGLLILAFNADNVSVTSPATGNSWSRGGRGDIAAAIVDDGTLTVDGLRIVKAARSMLTEILSCRADASRSGAVAAVAGIVLGADAFLPNFATAEFLACLSRGEVEAAAQSANLPVKAKLKDTRESLVAYYADGRFLPPIAQFQLSEKDRERLSSQHLDEDEAAADGAEDVDEAGTVDAEAGDRAEQADADGGEDGGEEDLSDAA